MYRRKWTDSQLVAAVESSRSIRQVIYKLNLVPAGGNYVHVIKVMNSLNLEISHFKGKGWSAGLKILNRKRRALDQILVINSYYQTHRLKRRLIKEGLKPEMCELCGWNERSKDGRIPLELDHINGDHTDQRLNNLRVLCPNCHALQPTHRGLNKYKRRGGETGQTRET